MKTRRLAILAVALLAGALSFSTLGMAQARTSGAPGTGCGPGGYGMMGGGGGYGMMGGGWGGYGMTGGGGGYGTRGGYGGYGMMGGYGGYGMMGGYGGYGMMGGWDGYGTRGDWGQDPATDGAPLTLEEARQAVEQALAENGLTNLAVGEVMEFECNFYAIAEGRDTGKAAMELLIDSTTGVVFPEYGPNMMWNTEYGHMGGLGTGAAGRWWGTAPRRGATLTPEQAWERAQSWLNRYQPGSVTEEPVAFPGYYTLHTERDGRITGMLSVHDITGRVWYHNWHGDFIATTEAEH